MGLSNLLGSSSGRSTNSKNLTSPSIDSLGSAAVDDGAKLEYISNEDQLAPPFPEPPDLRELNASLEALAAVFPDIQIQVFREILSNFDGESRLAVVADALLKNRMGWVKGRWKATERDGSKADEELAVPKSESFRTDDYKKAVKTLAYQEFRGLSKSTINAVLAESNYSYLEARRALVDLSSKSWRYAIASFFSRRKALAETELKTHPLVIWRSTGRGSIEPCLKPTGSAELDRELYTQLIAPIMARENAERELNDHKYAVALNSTEAEDAQITLECACCFADYAFEEFTSCTTEGHLICFRCVQHSISEAVFGQGWQRSIDKNTGAMICPAMDSECQGRISQDNMLRAMMEQTKGAEIMHKLEQRLAEHSLIASNVPLICCPFCSYAEIDDVYELEGGSQRQAAKVQPWWYKKLFIPILIITAPFPLIAVSAAILISSMFNLAQLLDDYLGPRYRAAQARFRRRRRGLRFRCANPECRRASCLSCRKEWVDIHICNESALVALRTQVEQAMSLAIKRVCPKCNTSFVKNAGCNKLTCPCGYKMCYVCRKDIGATDGPDAGYRHFCDHFRPEGDGTPCSKCNKCNLWETEDTDAVLKKAKEEAEKKWLETEDRQLSGAEKTYLETGLAVKPEIIGLGGHLRRWRLPTGDEFLDWFVEVVYAFSPGKVA
ncbi:putative E3 ubiquitin-protein ligase ARI4 [Echria macrotheca]|uniref:E3 ubiquitin-protein ligase ARI4 n=1 Tax=Echria macrotheca TaxID=438768 RepID=A0AAJ0B7W7_9PEZI|nr:putative E3 ubiquitin-protein ligase ARI4 [Echria macrotheca]